MALGFPDISSFTKVWYIGPTGNDTTGDGSSTKPFATLDKAVQSASNGQGIKILAGTYTFSLIPMNGGYSSAMIHDRGKALTIWGENERTVINCVGSSASTRDGNVVNLLNSASVLQNLKINYQPGKSNNYSNAIFVWSYGTIQNVFFENTGAQAWSYTYWNGGPSGCPLVKNCMFKTNGKGIQGDYSGQPAYINCIFDANSTPTMYTPDSLPNLARTIVTSDWNKPLTADTINKGSASILNPDGTRSNIGLCGGPFDWSYGSYKYFLSFNDRIYKVVSDIWLDVCARSDLTEQICKDVGMTVDELTRAVPLINQRDRCDILAYSPQPENAYTPIRKLIATPKPKLVLANGDIPLVSIQYINQVTVTSTTSGNGVMRFIASVDGGDTWVVFSNGAWKRINISDFNSVKVNGMTATVLNAITRTNWENLVGDANLLRFGYYFDVVTYSDIAKTDAISLNVDMRGAWMNNKEADWGYVNKSIVRVILYSTGDYKINY